MTRSEQHRRHSKKTTAATSNPEVPPQRLSNGDGPGATHTDGTVVMPAEASVATSDEQEQAAHVCDGKADKNQKDGLRTESTVDVAKEAALDAKVTGFWSFIGVNFGRMTRYMGSADKYQRKSGYFQLIVFIVLALGLTVAFTVFEVYGGKIALAGTAGTIALTSATVALRRRKKAENN